MDPENATESNVRWTTELRLAINSRWDSFLETLPTS